jgi:hypothetical protein
MAAERHAPPPVGKVVALGPRLAEAKGEAGFLGHLLYYSVARTHLTREELAEALEDAGVDERFLPRRISDRDAFRRAAKAAEETTTRHVPLGDPALFGGPLGCPHANVLLREVRATDGEIIRQVVREVVDAHDVRLSYSAVAQIELLPAPTDDVEPTVKVLRFGANPDNPGGPGLLSAEEQSIEALLDGYDFGRKHHDSDAVRRVLHAVLSEANPVPLRGSGGLYFVPRTREETTRSVVRLAAEVEERAVKRRSGSGRSSAVSVPLVDEEEYRDVITDSLQEQVARESRSLVDEMGRILKAEKRLSEKRQKEFVERVRALARNVVEYEALLETEISGARAGLELAGKAAMELLTRVESQVGS